jgi:ligand-binding sensor domain-containing protein
LPHNVVTNILEDQMRNLWMATEGSGLSKYKPASEGQNASFANFGTNEGLSSNNLWSLLKDRKGNLWITTAESGVIRYDGALFTHFLVKEVFSDYPVTSILESKK